jgi:hypothetical protein
VDALRDHGSTVTPSGDKAIVQCPSHDDGRASLSVGPRRDGKGQRATCPCIGTGFRAQQRQ